MVQFRKAHDSVNESAAAIRPGTPRSSGDPDYSAVDHNGLDDAVKPPPGRVILGPFRRFWPAILLLAGLLAAFLTGVVDYLSLETLALHRETMIVWVDANIILAAVSFALLVTSVAALSIPAIAVMNISAGFLFGPVPGTLIAAVGQTLGASVVFWASRHSFRETIVRRAGPMIRRMEAGFCDNALSYMITVRLMPMFPAWLVNLVPGVLGVKARTFVIGTAIGVIPCTFVFATVGSGLGSVIDAGQTPSMMIFLEPRIFFPFLGLGILAVLPMALRRWRGRDRSSDEGMSASADAPDNAGDTEDRSGSKESVRNG